jgi:hypothetical protein
LPPGPDELQCNARFGLETLALLGDAQRRRRLGRVASAFARERSAPDRCVARYLDAFDSAREHRERAKPVAPVASSRRHIARWTGMNALVVALGCLRKPATLNRNGQRQQGWGALANSPASPRRVDSTVPAALEDIYGATA